MTIGKNEMLNLRMPTNSNNTHASGNCWSRRSVSGNERRSARTRTRLTVYMAIQNILASTAFAGWSGWREGGGKQVSRLGRMLLFLRAISTYTAALKHPERRPVVVDLVPEAKTDEDAPGHVPDGPKVEGEQDDDENSLQRGGVAKASGQIPVARSLNVDEWARTEKT
jgi:hypothetical protein